MTKYVDVDKLHNDFMNWRELVGNKYDLDPSIDECSRILDVQPAADVVEVVRCKDCKYLNPDIAMGKWEGSCRYWNTHSVMLNDFCSYGECKEGEEWLTEIGLGR